MGSSPLAPLHRRVTAAAVAGAVFWSGAVGAHAQETRFWEARRAAAGRLNADSSDGGGLLSALPALAPISFQTPSTKPASAAAGLWAPLASRVAPFATVREVHLSAKAGAPFIVHVQDAHGVEEAQRHIAGLIGAFPAPPLVALEGAAGPLDLTPFRDGLDPEAVRKAAEAHFKAGRLTGAEFAGLTLPAAPVMIGAEDDALYHTHVRALMDSFPLEKPARARLAALQSEAERRKAAAFSPALLALDRGIAAYDTGRDTLGVHVRRMAGALGGMKDFPDAARFLQALALEESLDFAALDRDRRRFVAALSAALPGTELNALAAAAVALRDGRLSAAAFHRGLLTAARRRGVAVPPGFAAYGAYLAAAEAVDREGLMDDLERLREAAPAALARTPDEKNLLAQSRLLGLLDKLLRRAMTPKDWAAYDARADQARRLFGDAPALTAFEDFCRCALARNRALVDHLLAAQPGGAPAVLVAGGFHTDGLVRLLKERGCSYAVLTPRISEVPRDDNYLSAFAQDPLPLEKLFEGDAIFLVKPLTLGNGGDRNLALKLLADILALAVKSGETLRRRFRGAAVDAERKPDGSADIRVDGNAYVARATNGRLGYRKTLWTRARLLFAAITLTAGLASGAPAQPAPSADTAARPSPLDLVRRVPETVPEPLISAPSPAARRQAAAEAAPDFLAERLQRAAESAPDAVDDFKKANPRVMDMLGTAYPHAWVNGIERKDGQTLVWFQDPVLRFVRSERMDVLVRLSDISAPLRPGGTGNAAESVEMLAQWSMGAEPNWISQRLLKAAAKNKELDPAVRMLAQDAVNLLPEGESMKDLEPLPWSLVPDVLRRMVAERWWFPPLLYVALLVRRQPVLAVALFPVAWLISQIVIVAYKTLGRFKAFSDIHQDLPNRRAWDSFTVTARVAVFGFLLHLTGVPFRPAAVLWTAGLAVSVLKHVFFRALTGEEALQMVNARGSTSMDLIWALAERSLLTKKNIGDWEWIGKITEVLDGDDVKTLSSLVNRRNLRQLRDVMNTIIYLRTRDGFSPLLAKARDLKDLNTRLIELLPANKELKKAIPDYAELVSSREEQGALNDFFLTTPADFRPPLDWRTLFKSFEGLPSDIREKRLENFLAIMGGFRSYSEGLQADEKVVARFKRFLTDPALLEAAGSVRLLEAFEALAEAGIPRARLKERVEELLRALFQGETNMSPASNPFTRENLLQALWRRGNLVESLQEFLARARAEAPEAVDLDVVLAALQGGAPDVSFEAVLKTAQVWKRDPRLSRAPAGPLLTAAATFSDTPDALRYLLNEVDSGEIAPAVLSPEVLPLLAAEDLLFEKARAWEALRRAGVLRSAEDAKVLFIPRRESGKVGARAQFWESVTVLAGRVQKGELPPALLDPAVLARFKQRCNMIARTDLLREWAGLGEGVLKEGWSPLVLDRGVALTLFQMPNLPEATSDADPEWVRVIFWLRHMVHGAKYGVIDPRAITLPMLTLGAWEPGNDEYWNASERARREDIQDLAELTKDREDLDFVYQPEAIQRLKGWSGPLFVALVKKGLLTVSSREMVYFLLDAVAPKATGFMGREKSLLLQDLLDHGLLTRPEHLSVAIIWLTRLRNDMSDYQSCMVALSEAGLADRGLELLWASLPRGTENTAHLLERLVKSGALKERGIDTAISLFQILSGHASSPNRKADPTHAPHKSFSEVLDHEFRSPLPESALGFFLSLAKTERPDLAFGLLKGLAGVKGIGPLETALPVIERLMGAWTYSDEDALDVGIARALFASPAFDARYLPIVEDLLSFAPEERRVSLAYLSQYLNAAAGSPWAIQDLPENLAKALLFLREEGDPAGKDISSFLGVLKTQAEPDPMAFLEEEAVRAANARSDVSLPFWAKAVADKGRFTLQRLSLYRLPDNLRRAINDSGGLEALERSITPDNCRTGLYPAVLYARLRVLGLGKDIGHEEFLRLVVDPALPSPHRGLVDAVVSMVFDQPKGLTDEQKMRVAALSRALFRKMKEVLPLNGDSAVGIRDLMRFDQDFSRQYLRLQSHTEALDLFAAVAHAVYGRLIRSPKDQAVFNQALEDVLKAHADFLVMSGRDWGAAKMAARLDGIMARGDYQDPLRPARAGDVPLEGRLRALLDRALQSGRSLLLRLGEDNPVFLERLLARLGDEGAAVLSVAMSRFTTKKDLFGTYVPRAPLSDEEVEGLLAEAGAGDLRAALADVLALAAGEVDAHWADWTAGLNQDPELRGAVAARLKNPRGWRDDMAWEDGVLARTARAAAADPGRRFVVLFDNIQACPDRVRTLFNPVLESRRLRDADGRPLPLPANLQIVFTLPEDADIKDPSFMNRSLEQTPPAPDGEDILPWLGPVWADLWKRLYKERWDGDFRLSAHDLREMARRAEGLRRLKGETDLSVDVLFQEVHDYLWLRLATPEDREGLPQRILKAGKFPAPTAEYRDGRLWFGGVPVEASDEVKAYFQAHPRAGVPEALFDLYGGYVLGEMETRIMAQFARARAGFASPAFQLEGPSGEGKTRVADVFARLTALEKVETTVNQDTGLPELRGRQVRTRTGGQRYVDAPYAAKVGRPGHLFLFNEPNTSQENGVMHHLLPETAGRPRKLLPERPAAGADSLPLSTAIDRNNLWVFAVNDAQTAGREPTPALSAAHLTRFHAAQDPRRLPDTVQSIFTGDALLKKHPDLAGPLASAHAALRKAVADGALSAGQDVTRRELLRAVRRLRTLLSDGTPPAQALARALAEVYQFMWKNPRDLAAAGVLLQGALPQKFKPALAQAEPGQALEAALREGGPVMVFTDPTGPESLVDDALRRVHPDAVVHDVPVGYFQRQDAFAGGMTPARDAAGRRWSRLAPFAEGTGFVTAAVAAARLDPSRTHVLLLRDFTHAGAKTAPLLNEFLQGEQLGALEKIATPAFARALLARGDVRAAWPRLRAEYRDGGRGALPADPALLDGEEALAFTRWFHGLMPANLRVVATGDAREPTFLGAPEMDRFSAVNLSAPFTPSWIAEYIRAHAGPALAGHGWITVLAVKAFHAYEDERNEEPSAHNRLGRADLDAFLAELREQAARGPLTDEVIDKVAYYSLGAGLREESQAKLPFRPSEMTDPEARISYHAAPDGLWLEVDGIRCKTFLQEPPDPAVFRAATAAQVRLLASFLIGVKNGRLLAAEGQPGGGKSVVFEELALRLGLPGYKAPMYADVDPGDFLGRLTRQGKDFLLTGAPGPDGRYLLPFLKAYTEGGIFLLDEGAIGLNGREVISLLARLARMDSFDLGAFHPGLSGHVLKRAGGPLAPDAPPFILGIAQNPARTTPDREPLPPAVDAAAQKAWVSNVPTRADAVRLVRHYMNGAARALPEAYVEAVADLHLGFCRTHPRPEELSPRQLIELTLTLRRALEAHEDVEAAFLRGVMLLYLGGLDDGEFAQMREELPAPFRGPFDHFLARWDQAPSVERSASGLRMAGVTLPASAAPSTVGAGDVRLDDDLAPLNRVQWALAAKFAGNGHAALLEEDGADALDALRRFCRTAGWGLDVLWCHPQMTGRMHLLSVLMPRFQEAFDRHGVKMEDASGELLQAMNFLARRLVPEDRLAAESAKPREPLVLFFHLMDAIPERQRVLLNELLTTRRIDLPGPGGARTFVLPPWIKIAVSMPEEHAFSSAFINRFDQPIRVKALTEPEDVVPALRRRFPLVTKEEAGWIAAVAGGAHDLERTGALGLRYGLSPADAFKLALHVQAERQADAARGRAHGEPAYYVLKACRLTYGLDGADREKIEALLLKTLQSDVFHRPFMTKGILDYFQWAGRTIDAELADMELEVFTHEVEAARLASGGPVVLENGIEVRRLGAGYEIRTPANTYRVFDEELDGPGKVLSRAAYPARLEGRAEERPPLLRVRLERGVLSLDLSLVKSLGGAELSRDDWMRRRSLPEGEIATGEWALYTPDLRRHAAALLRHWRPFRDAAGWTHRPRVTLRNGETGTVKTVLARNMERLWGLPVHVVDVSGDFKVSDATASLRLEKGRLLLVVKEALMRVGAVNGRTLAAPSGATSTRTLLSFDESNAAPDLVYALQPLLRGERRFTLHYAGETLDVELFPEAIVDLSFNPAERYSGRHPFPPGTVSFGEKTWAPDPMARVMDPSDPTVPAIQEEVHRRGILRYGNEERPWVSSSGHHETPPSLLRALTEAEVSLPAAPSPSDFLSSWNGAPAAPAGKEAPPETGETEEVSSAVPAPAQRRPPIVYDVAYDVDGLRRAAREFTADKGGAALVQDVLRGFLFALANGDAPEDLRSAVLDAAARLGEDVAGPVLRVAEEYARPMASRTAVEAALFDLRRALAARDVFLYKLWLHKRTGTSYMTLSAENILDRLVLAPADLGRLGLDPAAPSLAGRKLQAVVVRGDRSPMPRDGTLAYFEGEFAVVMAERTTAALKGASDAGKIRWAGWHELGHMVDEARGRVPANGELHAALFPLIFDKDAGDYAVHELIGRLQRDGDPRDAYCQANKGVLNGLFQELQDEFYGLPELFLDNTFPPAVLDEMAGALAKIPSPQLNAIGARLYQNPSSLDTAEPGAYRSSPAAAGGDAAEEVMAGVDGEPPTEISEGGAEGPETQVNAPAPQPGAPRLNDDRPPRPGTGGKTGKTGTAAGRLPGVLNGASGEVMDLLRISPEGVSRFLEIYAGAPKTLRRYADEGDDLDWELYIAGVLEAFLEEKQVRSPAGGEIGVTVDVSGSTHRSLAGPFDAMSRYFMSLFHLAAVRNKKLDFTLSAIGEEFHPVLEAVDCRRREAVSSALGGLRAWRRQDAGGINTVNLLAGLEEKFRSRPKGARKTEIVFTDGGETSGVSFAELRRMVSDLEKKFNVDIVFVGIETKDVANYNRYLLLNHNPQDKELLDILLGISLLKAKGRLPEGDLAEPLRLGRAPAAAGTWGAWRFLTRWFGIPSSVIVENVAPRGETLASLGSFVGAFVSMLALTDAPFLLDAVAAIFAGQAVYALGHLTGEFMWVEGKGWTALQAPWRDRLRRAAGHVTGAFAFHGPFYLVFGAAPLLAGLPTALAVGVLTVLGTVGALWAVRAHGRRNAVFSVDMALPADVKVRQDLLLKALRPRPLASLKVGDLRGAVPMARSGWEPAARTAVANELAAAAALTAGLEGRGDIVVDLSELDDPGADPRGRRALLDSLEGLLLHADTAGRVQVVTGRPSAPAAALAAWARAFPEQRHLFLQLAPSRVHTGGVDGIFDLDRWTRARNRPDRPAVITLTGRHLKADTLPLIRLEAVLQSLDAALRSARVILSQA